MRSSPSIFSKLNKLPHGWGKPEITGNISLPAGTGGSASTASHFACDVVKGCSYQKDKRFRIMALTDSLATLTGILERCFLRLRLCGAIKKLCATRRCGSGHQRLR